MPVSDTRTNHIFMFTPTVTQRIIHCNFQGLREIRRASSLHLACDHSSPGHAQGYSVISSALIRSDSKE